MIETATALSSSLAEVIMWDIIKAFIAAIIALLVSFLVGLPLGRAVTLRLWDAIASRSVGYAVRWEIFGGPFRPAESSVILAWLMVAILLWFISFFLDKMFRGRAIWAILAGILTWILFATLTHVGVELALLVGVLAGVLIGFLSLNLLRDVLTRWSARVASAGVWLNDNILRVYVVGSLLGAILWPVALWGLYYRAPGMHHWLLHGLKPWMHNYLLSPIGEILGALVR